MKPVYCQLPSFDDDPSRKGRWDKAQLADSSIINFTLRKCATGVSLQRVPFSAPADSLWTELSPLIDIPLLRGRRGRDV